jgi:hypothetical protein
VPVSDRESFARWLRNGVPGFLAVALFVAIVVHVTIRGPWSRIVVPCAVLVAIQLALYISMYWIRKRFQHTHNLRLGVLVFGSYCLVMGLMALRYAAQLGLVSPKVATDNYLSFSIFMLIVILMSVVVFSIWKLE